MVYLKFSMFGRRIAFYMRKVQSVKGVNSDLPDGKHIPMLDVDDRTLRQVENEAARVQDRFGLGPAHIFSTGRPGGWHVYFLSRVDWKEAMRIAVDFDGTDTAHLVWSLRRGHFTLRFGRKSGRPVEFVSLIDSVIRPTAWPHELASFTLYETAGLE